jgi:hypothetical protein
MAKPEKMWSPFSPSDKFKTNNRPGSPLSPRGIDATPVYTPISPLSPHGIASKKPTIDPNKSFGQGQIPSIQVKPNSTK